MELEEAKDIINISEKEKASIKRYLGFLSTRINALGNFSPETYVALAKGWAMQKNGAELLEDIQNFVNLYSAMYKERKKSTYGIRVVRGTSEKLADKMNGVINSFISTSTDEEIAKTFTEYGAGALVYLNVSGDVPFLDPDSYMSENSNDEREIILSPFCKATSLSKTPARDKNSFSYYRVKIERQELVERTPEELDNLQTEIIQRFSENIEDIKKYAALDEKFESLSNRLRNIQGSLEERIAVSEEREKVLEELSIISSRTSDYRDKLRSLLEGLCKQKELEIDEAHKTIEDDKQRKEAERKENYRKEEVYRIANKLAKNSQEVDILQTSVENVYEGFIGIENKAKSIAGKFGFFVDRTIDATPIRQLVTEIQRNIQDIGKEVKSIEIDESRITFEEVENLSKKIEPLLDGVSYGTEITANFTEIQDLYRKQLENEIKKGIYDKVQQVLQNARIQKHLQEKAEVQNEKIGFLGRLTGKEFLREEKLKNLDLKIQLVKESKPRENENYSIREMLADMHICADAELCGQFTPEMQQLYDLIKSTYGNKKTGEFTEEYIKSIANKKALGVQEQKSGLPAIPTKMPRFFGKTKARIKSLELENAEIKRMLLTKRTAKSTLNNHQQIEDDALTILEQRLRGIANNTISREDRQGYKHATFDLWK